MTCSAWARWVCIASAVTTPPRRSIQRSTDLISPLTGRACVHRVVTDLGVIDVTDNGLVLVETAPGVTHHDITAATAAKLHTAA